MPSSAATAMDGVGESSGRPVCEECGYDVSGLGRGAGVVPCPECGKPVDLSRPFVIEPWPAWWRLAVRMSWPVAVFVGGVGLLPALGLDDDVVVSVWPLWLSVWVWLAVVRPLGIAAEIAGASAVRVGRRRMMALAGAAGLGVNLLVTGVMVVLSIMML